MSFSKAKLLRFNEVANGTPSPADYKVSLASHSGSTIPKSGRFVENQSPASSINSSVTSSCLQQTFRTPNPPKKVRCPSSRKPKPEVLFQSVDVEETLKEKTVECNNKDLYIQELMEQIEDMKHELNDLKNKISSLDEDKSALQSSIDELNSYHGANINKIETKHKNEITLLTDKLNKLTEILRVMKTTFLTFKTENETSISHFVDNIETVKRLFNNLQTNYNLLFTEKEEIKVKLESEINDLKKNHQNEIEQLESDTLKTVTRMQNLIEEENVNGEVRLNKYKIIKEKEICDLKDKYQMLHDDFEAKVKQLEENHKEATILSEILMKEKYEDIERGWKMKLKEVEAKTDASLMEYQAIIERNAIQNEIQNSQVLCDIAKQKEDLYQLERVNEKMKADYDSLQNEHKRLRAELSKIIIELNTTREEHSKEIKQRDVNVNRAMHDKHLYEITVQKTHKTVEALKKRLMKSDHDVEQLKAELEATEGSKLEAEGRCNRLMEELEVVTGLCDVVEEQNELAVRVARERIAKLEEELLNKVDFFKIEAEKKIKIGLEEFQKTKNRLQQATDHLYEQQALNTKAQEYLAASQSEISRLELLCNEYSSKMATLECSNKHAQEQLISLKQSTSTIIDENCKLNTVIELMQASESDLLNQINDFKQQLRQKDVDCDKHLNEIKEIRETRTKLEEKLLHVETENVQLRQKVLEQDLLIGPFRSQLQDYENEYNALLSEKENVEREVKEIGLKYAEILGHQNHKQKIKHMIDLKKQNHKLCDDNKQLEHKLKTQDRMIEKLKSAITPKKVSQKNKENLSNVSLNSSRIDSPGPLKDLN